MALLIHYCDMNTSLFGTDQELSLTLHFGKCFFQSFQTVTTRRLIHHFTDVKRNPIAVRALISGG